MTEEGKLSKAARMIQQYRKEAYYPEDQEEFLEMNEARKKRSTSQADWIADLMNSDDDWDQWTAANNIENFREQYKNGSGEGRRNFEPVVCQGIN